MPPIILAAVAVARANKVHSFDSAMRACLTVGMDRGQAWMAATMVRDLAIWN